MTAPSFHLTSTKPYAGITLRRLTMGPVGWILWMAVLSFPFWHFLRQDDALPLGIAIAVVLSFLLLLHRFIRRKLEDERETPFSPTNLAGMLGVGVVKALRPRHCGSHDMLAAALGSSRARFILEEIGLRPEEVLQQHQSSQEPFDVVSWMQEAMTEAELLGEKRIDANIILHLFFQKEPLLKLLLDRSDLSAKDLEHIVRWELFHMHALIKEPWYAPRRLVRNIGTFGRGWVMGYTHDLDSLTVDISERSQWHAARMTVLHQKEIETMQRIVYRSTQHNILLLGKVGAGKKTLIENFAAVLRESERRNNLRYTRVLLLQPELLLSGKANPDAFLLNALARAQRAGRFILIIPDTGALLRSSSGNLKSVLVQFLQAKNINIIGVIDAQDYHTLVKTEPTLDNLFEKVTVEDALEEETMAVLMEQYLAVERKGVHIPYKALKAIVELCKRYIGRGAFPGKAVDVMEDAILTTLRAGEKVVTEARVRDVISLKAKMNVQEVTEGEKEKLLHIEEALQRKIIGQEEAIHALANALKRGRLDIGTRKRPIGTFLFLGPTGVGKTETAKVLAETYFSSADRIIRLDMNEYGTEESVYEIIGSPDPGAGHAEGFLTKRVQDQPFSLVLLDEIEKAHPKVLNLFLQVLDEGQLTDGLGNKTDFRNVIIIATSNAGALFIRDFFKAQENTVEIRASFKQQLIDEVLKLKLFSPEFMNRFDEIVIYFPMTRAQAKQLAILMIGAFINDFQEKKGISVVLEEDAVDALAAKGYSIEFGAREMRRVITEALETHLAEYLLRNTVQRGETMTVRKEDLEL